MNELGEFFITFRTTGITELLDQMKDLNVKLDNLNNSFEKGVSKGDSFFSKFTSWGLQLTALATGFVSVGKAISDAFKIGGEITKLNVAADVAGVKAEQVEALAIAIAPLKGGQKDYASAANFYRQMTETQTQWWRGQYSEKVIEEMSRARVTGLKANSTPTQWMNGLIDALHYYQGQHTQQAIGARNLFAKAFGLTDEQMLLFAEGRDYVNQQLQYGYNHLTLSGEGNLRKAIEQTRAKMEFNESWENLVTNLIPLTTDIYNALQSVVTFVNDFLKSETWKDIGESMKFFTNVFKRGWDTIVKWFEDKETPKDPKQEQDDAIASLFGGRNTDAYWNAQKILGHTYGTIPYTVNDLINLQGTMERAGTLDPQFKNAIQNEINRLGGQGYSLIADPKIRELKSKLSYDPNVDFATELLLAADRNKLNSINTSTDNSRSVTANFGNMYINGTENVGRDVKNQLQAAVNSMGDK